MIGAIIGDVIGSIFENENLKSEDFPLFSRFSRFTDDTVLTVAVADAILNRRQHRIRFIEDRNNKQSFALYIKSYARRFPHAGYGQMFKEWASGPSLRGYGSFGNGSAMRVSPIGFAFDDLVTVLGEARLSATVTHNHPDGIKGAQAVASAIFMARHGETKDTIKQFIQQKFGYNLNQRLAESRPHYIFDASCNGSVPQAMIAFLESQNFEDAIRKAISLGGDSDTIACMAGGVAQAFYKAIPQNIVAQVNLLLDLGFKQVIANFNQRYDIHY